MIGFFFWFIWPSCLRNRGFQNSIKVSLQVLLDSPMHKVKIFCHCFSWCYLSTCSAYIPLNNYMVFNDVDGLYTYTFEAERKVCSWISSARSCLLHVIKLAFCETLVYVHFWCRKTVQPAAKYLWTCTFLHLPHSRRWWTTWLRVLPCTFAFLIIIIIIIDLIITVLYYPYLQSYLHVVWFLVVLQAFVFNIK